MLPPGPWQIVGAGSLGCLFAAYLRRADIDVRLVLRDEISFALWQRSTGITLQRDGTQETLVLPALSAKQVRGPLQKLLICTKAHQTLDAVTALRNAIAPDAVLILLQNGMGVREQLVRLLPSATILHALSTEGAYQIARFHIVHAGRGSTVIGATCPAQQPWARAGAQALQCELNLQAVDNIDQRLWQKLAVNSVINPLTALFGCRNGELLAVAGIDATLRALCDELVAVADAAGQRLIKHDLMAAIRQVAQITAHNKSSMLQDIEQQRSTEIDFINGYIVRLADQHGIACTAHRALLEAIKQREVS